jgi:ferritin-like metal-binding protein YciE
MKLLSEKIQDLQTLYTRELRFLLSAEEMTAIKSAFLVDSTHDEDLKKILSEQWLLSKERAINLRAMLSRSSPEHAPIKCRAIYALFDEAEDLVKDAAHEAIVNSALVTVARRIKHYEIAYYEGVLSLAAVLKHDEDVPFLEKSFQQVCAADQQLASIATWINAAAKTAA